jgi:hypothetical protein
MVICAILEHGIFILQNTFHWVKSIAIPDGANGGEPVQRGHDCHEYIFHLTMRGDVALDRLAVGVAYTHKSNIAWWNHTVGRDRHCRGNTWLFRIARSRAAPLAGQGWEDVMQTTRTMLYMVRASTRYGRGFDDLGLPEDLSKLEPEVPAFCFQGIVSALQSMADPPIAN